MFRGTNHINVDSKYRVAIPARYRDTLLQESAGKLVANIDINDAPCIAIYPLPVWERVERSIEERLRNVGQSARIRRMMFSRASEVDMDASGRVLLPADLREHINLEKKSVLVGVGQKLELWRDDEWEIEEGKAAKELEDLALIEEIVQDIGFI